MSLKRTADCVDPTEDWVPYKRCRMEDHEFIESYLPSEVLVNIFKFLSMPDIARSVVPVCQRWRDLGYTEVEPQQLHVKGHKSHLYMHAVQNYKVSALIMTEGTLNQIAALLCASAQRNKTITTVVAHGMSRPTQGLTKEEFHILANVAELAIYAEHMAYLTYFPKVTRLQLLHCTTDLPRFANKFDHAEELAVDAHFLTQNYQYLLSLFPSLKKIHVTNDPQFTALAVEDQLKALNKELVWPHNYSEHQLVNMPYHQLYYRTGQTMAVSNFSALVKKWKKTIESDKNKKTANMSSSENKLRANITSFEYEKELQRKPAKYIYPSALDFSKRLQISDEALIAAISDQAAFIPNALDMIVNSQLLPYWTTLDMCMEYDNLDLLLQVLKDLKNHTAAVQLRVVQRLIERLGVAALVDNLGFDAFVLLANSSNQRGSTLVHRFVKKHMDLDEISPYIRAWDVVNGKGMAPIDIAMQDWNMPVVMFLLLHGAQFRSIGIGFPLQSFLSYAITYYGNHPHQLELAEIIRQLVTYYGAAINYPDQSGDSCLGVAIKTGNPVILQLILELGGNVHWPCSNGMKPVPLVCRLINNINDFKCMINCLVEYGADINATGIQFYADYSCEISPLVILMDKPNPQPYMRHLISHGASLNSIDAYGWTVLHYYIQKVSDQDRVARLLQQKIPNCSVQYEGGEQYLNLDASMITAQISEQVLEEIFSDNA